MNKIKEPIRLRSRLLKNGSSSLYLDCYCKGKRFYEYLHLYLIPNGAPNARVRNQETMRLAEAIKAKRIIDLQLNTNKFPVKKDTKLSVILEHFLEYKKQIVSQGSFTTYEIRCKLLLSFPPAKNADLTDIDEKWIDKFKSFLVGKKYSDNYITVMLKHIKCLLKFSFENDYIDYLPAKNYRFGRLIQTPRTYLTIEELRRLVQTPDKHTTMRRAFLFACFTGLRFSDVRNLTWGDIETNAKYTRIVFRQKKTRNLEYLDIAPQAVEYLGERGEADAKVFEGIYHSNHSYIFDKWTERAGIKKHISFHSARHTFAIMMVELGIDLFVVSKLLGHKNINTTQIYAKILDKSKQQAIDKIPHF